MPIEDVDYLKQNSIVQSYIFLVDSKDRDHETYPTPSEYVTTFTAPFTNVIGLQLMDASVPRTMYNIDTYNNTISFYIHSYGETSALSNSTNYKTVEIETGNYTIQTLLPALTSALNMYVDNNPINPLATITAKSVSNPPEQKNKIEFRCPYPFAFDMKNSTINETLGFDLFPYSTEMYKYKKFDMPISQSNQQIFHSVNITTSNSIYNTGQVSFCNILVQPFVSSNAAVYTVSGADYIAQRFTVSTKTYVKNVAMALSGYSSNVVPYSICTGSSNSPSLNQTLASSVIYTDGASSNSSITTSVIQSPILANSNTYYWLVTGNNSINTGVYYNSNVSVSNTVLLHSGNSGTSWTGTSNSQLVTTISGDLLYSNPILSDPYNLFVGPRGVLRKIDLSSTQLAAQRFAVTTKTFLTTVYAAFAFDSGNPVPFTVRIGSSNEPYMSSDYLLLSSNMNIDYVNGTLSENAISTPVLLMENLYYWIVFGGNNMVGNTAIYYNDINPYIGLHTLYSSSNSGDTWSTPDVADINYQLSIQLVVADEYNRIEAPGIFNLIGEPYIVLRCPEIEQNSFRSLSFMKHNLGLAKINLGIVGYAEKRFDYSSVPVREFHPIGKFSRMTIRFETASGKLYDFKGVNHTLTFAVRYYEPVQKKQFENSIINPNYDGNFLKYMYHRGDDNAEEDSVDEDEDYSRDNIENYRIVESRNTPERLEYEDREIEWYYDR